MRSIYHQHAALHALGAGTYAGLTAIMFRMAGRSPAHESGDTVMAWVFAGFAFGHVVLCLVNYARSRRAE